MTSTAVCSALALLLGVYLSGCVNIGLSTEAATEPIDLPRLDGVVINGVLGSDEWVGAWSARGEFVITDAGELSGTFPFELRMGGNDAALFLAVRVWNLGPNDLHDEKKTRIGDVIEFHLADEEGPLTIPSDGISCSYIWERGSSCLDLYWDGAAWIPQRETTGSSGYNGGRPTDGRWGMTALDDGGAAVWEQVIHRTSSIPRFDGFQAPGPTEFRLAISLARFPDGSGIDPPVSSYPSGRSDDPTGWLRVRLG